jgi:hypothetical protein
MSPLLAGSTLLDRMVARAAEPAPAIPAAMPAPAAWGEEIREPVARPARAQISEPATPVPMRQAARAIEAAPARITQVRETTTARSMAPLVVQPATSAEAIAAPDAEDADEPLAEAAPRTAVIVRETTVVEPALVAQAPSPKIRAAAPGKLQPGPVLPRREERVEPVDAPPAAPVPARKRTTPPVVQPDLPVSLPMRESGPAPAPPLEPVIHVTIGRLEVRAPERERKPRAAERRTANTGLSLEQYLARRRGGGQA